MGDKRVLRNTSGFLLVVGLLVCLPTAADIAAAAEKRIELIGTLRIEGDARDLSGDDTPLENGEPRNRLGGFSALDYSASDNILAALSDRGPDDGAVEYPCRVQLFKVHLTGTTVNPLKIELEQTVFFRDRRGRHFSGSSGRIEATERSGHRFDPEGFRFGPARTMFVSDEYGPELMVFSAGGDEQRRLPVPEYYRVQHPHPEKQAENTLNQTGRGSNHGMEGLAISTDGKKLIGIMQGPLLQDGERGKNNASVGTNCRVLEVTLATGAMREFVYQTTAPHHGNSEIMTVGPDEYLVLERDSEDRKYRRLVRISLTGATDIHGRAQIPSGAELTEIVPVRRQDYIDLLDPQWGLSGEAMPEKVEGLTFGPVLPDGDRTLLVGTDNDFESAAASLIWIFRIPGSHFPDISGAAE